MNKTFLVFDTSRKKIYRTRDIKIDDAGLLEFAKQKFRSDIDVTYSNSEDVFKVENNENNDDFSENIKDEFNNVQQNNPHPEIKDDKSFKEDEKEEEKDIIELNNLEEKYEQENSTKKVINFCDINSDNIIKEKRKRKVIN